MHSSPLAVDIREDYPSLTLRKVVSYKLNANNVNVFLGTVSLLQFKDEFKKVSKMTKNVGSHTLMESWPTWKERIIAYSRLEMTYRPTEGSC